MKLELACFLVVLFITSCSTHKKRRSQVGQEVNIISDKSVMRSDYYEEERFRPFSVERGDGIYEVLQFNGDNLFQDIVLNEYPAISKTDMKMVKVAVDEYQNSPVVSVELTKEGTLKFEKITEKNIGKPIAVVVDSKLVMVPVINNVISEGRFIISGNFNMYEVKKMVRLLKRK